MTFMAAKAALVALLITAPLLGSAAPQALKRPFYQGPALLRRSTSQDPSCPEGFLCVQQTCPAGVICAAGESCVDFEGTLACAPSAPQWCALDPTTFEGVGCQAGIDGICCHGNCYNSGAVCCDNDQVQCTVGTACNVCPAGQTCGSSGCIGGQTSSSSTSSASTPGTSSSSAGSQTSSSGASSTTSPSVPSVPTVVPSVGTFGDPTCYVDNSSQHVLTNGSSTDAVGMTVEECVNLANQGAWQFAGLEAGGECFYGDVEVDAQSAAQSNCMTAACPGNQTEACGGSNAILIYQDSAWIIEEAAELASNLTALESLLITLQQDIQLWDTLLGLYQQALNTNSSSSKRDEEKRQATAQEIIQLFQEILQQYNAIMAGKDQVDAMLQNIQKLFQISLRFRKIQQVEQTTLVEQISEPIKQVLEDVSSPDAVIPEAGAAADAAVNIAEDALGAIGTAEATESTGAVIAATGVFSIIDALIDTLLGTNPPGTGTGTGNSGTSAEPSMSTTATSTSSSTSSTSTSSTCTATATQTPVIILTKAGTTLAQYKELVASLPENDTNIQLTSWQPNMAYIATLNQCQSENLTSNPIVETWSIDAPLDIDDNDTNDTISDASKRSAYGPSAGDGPNNLRTRVVPDANSFFKLQSQSPGHLQWLSVLSEYALLNGDYLGFSDFLYNDPVNTSARPLVYVIDSGFANTHEALAPALVAQYGIDANAQSNEQQTAPPTNHGTCMASLAAGAYSAVGKHSRLVTIQLDFGAEMGTTVQDLRASRALAALQAVYDHAVSNQGIGNAVVSMSWGVTRTSLYWRSPLAAPPGTFPNQDVFDVLLSTLWNVGITTVSSAGNDALQAWPANMLDLSYKVPRSKGGTTSPHIVVGNCQYDGTRFASSQYLDANNQGILTIYNVGTNVDCAVPLTQGSQDINNLGWGVEPAGSSQAAAITSGMIAYWLGQPALQNLLRSNGARNVPAAVKAYLLIQANTYKGSGGFTNTVTGLMDTIPRAATGDIVPCPNGMAAQPGPAPALNPFIPNPGFLRSLTTTNVTNGQEVVIVNPAPVCYSV